MDSKKIVLITGTTSGIGGELLDHYYRAGWLVISVNRRDDVLLAESYSKASFYNLDISSLAAVQGLCRKLMKENNIPKLFILNAGINKTDNFVDKLDYDVFTEVLRVNLLGAMSFVSAAREYGNKNSVFLGISSTSNIIPNPGSIAYYISKWGIAEGFKFLKKNDPDNTYKSVVLGPVKTGIMKGDGGPVGWQKSLFDFLARDAKESALVIANFAENKKSTLLFPLPVCLFYYSAKLLLIFFPFLYVGTRKKS